MFKKTKVKTATTTTTVQSKGYDSGSYQKTGS